MEITNGEIVMNRTNEEEKKEKERKKGRKKNCSFVWENCKEVRGFFGQGEIPPLIPVSTHPSFVYDALITYPVDRSAIEFDLSLAREGGKRKKEGKLRSFSPRSYFFPLCSILEGIVLKISWHWRDTRLCLISRPTLLHPIDNGTLNRLSSFYHSSLSLGPRKGRTYVSLTFFLITPINFPSVGTEKDR